MFGLEMVSYKIVNIEKLIFFKIYYNFIGKYSNTIFKI